MRLLAAVEQARPDIPLGHEIFRAFSPEESRGNAPREALRATLSAAAFNSAWSEGAALSIEDAAEQAAGGRP
ncbi:MAG TPA: hypothetical protein VK689_01180 [Armatimonadota bacterium]|nr:hypothetical protein [Armatimonadota bacterium]